ncbi:MAG TPA: FUSC family protein [Jatrophihabitans sp.]|nr:FUSC family protein [Jatrophihabitans sp.]
MSVRTAARPIPAPPDEYSPHRGTPEWVDRLLGSDPGLTRLLTALQAVATIGAAMLAEWGFVRWTRALQLDTHGGVLPPAQAAAVAAQHHAVLVIAILLGAIMGMLASFSGALFTTPRAQLISFALMPVPMVAGLAVGLALAPHRVLELAGFVAVIVVGAYCRRFGTRGFVGGMVLFIGYFFGFSLKGALRVTDLGWPAAEIVIGVLVAIAAQFTLFYPSRRAALSRMRHSYGARARAVATAALEVFQGRGDRARARRRLHRRLVRLNETALMIDAHLGDPGALAAGRSAAALHQQLFDSELALTNLARFADTLAGAALPERHAELIGQALAAVAERELLRAEFAGHELLALLRLQPDRPTLGIGPDDSRADQDLRVVTHRFAVSVLGYTEAAQGRRTESDSSPTDPAEAFAPSVALFGGWLPGSALVSAAASLEPGRSTPHRPGERSWRDRLRIGHRVRLAAHSRVAIQMSVAATAAILLGDLVSGRRFYWAVLAAFVTFMGANNTGEQVRKGFFRVAGTVVGVLLGALGAHLVGDRTGVAITVILISLFLGMYLIRISYAFLVVGITIMVSQLYVQLGEFTNSLLVVRLEETAIGAGVTALVVLCVLPLHTVRVARVAARQYVQALADVIEPAVQRLSHGGGPAELRAALRLVDSAYQALLTTMIPLHPPFIAPGDTRRERIRHTTAAARHYARNLLADTAADRALPAPVRDQLDRASAQLTASVGELINHLQDHDPTHRVYVRSAALFDCVASDLESSDYLAPEQLALRDLQRLDGAMATLAQTLGLTVHALDTAPTP